VGRRGLGHNYHWYADIPVYILLELSAGNVQVDKRHLATPHDRFVPDMSASTIERYRHLHESILEGAASQGRDTPLTIAQLSHPGLQSSPLVSLARLPWSPALAPISARPDLGTSYLGQLLGHLIWPVKSRRLSPKEWTEIVDQFVQGAWVMEQAGWGGVQIHSAHGYLLAEYLSPHVSDWAE
jgi:2,4-dienoyl-CoA reductase-like NADH-dependent reductase (Old Yellow Enzyme family)